MKNTDDQNGTTFQPWDTAPTDGRQIAVLMRSGAITVAEYWEPPPIELDPKQLFGGWAFDTQCLSIALDDEPVGWKPCEEAEIEQVPI